MIMATTALDNNAAKNAELQSLRNEMEALRLHFEERIAAMEALLPKPGAPMPEPVTAETLAILAAAVTSFLGKKVRIRSAHLLHAASPWAQAGRAIVQASHNLSR
jgi:hypothetical protein